ncbi:MAG: DUF3226 domain-containing protein [Euryarchaeota archaeon]|nr:DUF3226 domain-containing protein [Euryarchaeota archaeon]
MELMKSIREKTVLAVEGKDEVNFFDALLRYLEITGFEIRDVGGKSRFKDKLPALVKMSGFSDVEALAVIRDADKDANAAFDSVRYVLTKEGLEPPARMNWFSDGNPVIGIFIMPGDSDRGMLEDLCLRTVKDHPAMECVDIFVDCVSELADPPKTLEKAKTQAFLASMPTIVNSIGLGAQKGYWNFDSSELSDLVSFIDNLR